MKGAPKQKQSGLVIGKLKLCEHVMWHGTFRDQPEIGKKKQLLGQIGDFNIGYWYISNVSG